MDDAELRDDDLHERRMARRAAERAEKESMRAEIARLQEQSRLGDAAIELLAGERDDYKMRWLGSMTPEDAALIRAENERLRAAVEDAIETLEAMDLHIDNPLYDRLRGTLESNDEQSGESK